MTNDFMDFVLTENSIGKKRVFILPEFSHIKPGDIVANETEDGETRYNVIASCTLRPNDEALDFIMKMCDPEKAYKIYRVDVMNFKEEKTDE